jgi:hypothetical protein
VEVGELTLSMHTVLPVAVNDVYLDFKSAADDVFLYELNVPREKWTDEEIDELTD